MPRPSLADVRRPQLLDAYVRSILRYGPDGTTLDRVAEEAGVTRALVRHYLGNRRDVDRALVAHIRDRTVGWVRGVGAGLPPRERVTAMLDGLFGGQEPELPARVVDALLGASSRDPVLEGLLREMYLALEHLFAEELAAAFPGADPEARHRVAYAILCLAGMDSSLSELGFPADRHRFARSTAESLLAELEPAGRRPAPDRSRRH
jgi:AcrR family transcriptional regulator